MNDHADVVFQDHAPTSGSAQCVFCGGWIVSAITYGLNGKYPICPTCFEINKPDPPMKCTFIDKNGLSKNF